MIKFLISKIKRFIIHFWYDVFLEFFLYHTGLIDLHPVKKLRIDAITNVKSHNGFIYVIRAKMPFRRRIERSLYENRYAFLIAGLLYFLDPMIGILSSSVIFTFGLAIAFDAASSSAANTETSLSFSHTCSGSNRVLTVSAGVGYAGAGITGTTYNSVTMAEGASYVGSPPGDHQVKIYYLGDPATGSNTVTISFSGSPVGSIGGAISFTGANPSSPIGATGTSDSEAISITTTYDNSIVVSIVYQGSSSGTLWTVGSGQTQRWYQLNSNPDGEGCTEVTTTAGAVSVDHGSRGADLGLALEIREFTLVTFAPKVIIF